MNTSIYDLSYDFIQQNGHYIVFTKQGQRPLKNIDLHSLQIKMIQSNTIPRLLPIKVDEMNFQVQLLYEISSKRMLRLFLRENNLSMNDYYTLFLNVISVLEDSQLYMLDSQNFVLTEDFIFVGKNLDDIYLTYLPLSEIPGKPSMIEDLKHLLLNVAGEVQELDGAVYRAILSCVKESNFSLAGLKEQLRELQSSSRLPSSKPFSAKNPPLVEDESAPLENVDPDSKPLWIHEVVETTYDSHRNNVSTEREQELTKVDSDSLPPLTQRGKIYMFAFVFIALALIWKLYGSFPDQMVMYVCSILSLIIALAAIVFWKFWRPGFQMGAAEAIVAQANKEVSSFGIDGEAPFAANHAGSESLMGANDSVKQSYRNKEDYYKRLNEKTTLLSRPEDTVMLGEEVVSMPLFPHLIIERNGETEKIDIQEQPFVIGRNPSSVQYVEDSAGVSRAHLEIVKADTTFGAKDLGSKNGSMLNGKMMVPYKIYALKDQDQLVIGMVSFVFRAGSGR